ncbi:RES domain-containing protein [Prevotella sp. tc2-28]|nr:RES domain-containing protein [Prevotella sp. tc2-28]
MYKSNNTSNQTKCEVNLYSKMIEYVHSHNGYKSLNGCDILWFPLVTPLNVSMYDYLKDVFEKYEALINLHEFTNEISSEIKDEVKKVINGLLSVLMMYKTGDVIEAFKEFEVLMDGCYKDSFPIKKLEIGHTFYRMRANKHNIMDEKEFYHIPSKLRHLCASYRFSIAGYPCLYLGYSKNVCFSEISNNGTMCGLELLRQQSNDLFLLDLTFPKTVEKAESDTISNFIKAWPLVVSCYIVMANSQINRDSKFREEYIIPQMLTAYLKHKTKLDGICYYSTRNENLDPYGKDEEDYRNVVLFTNLSENDDYDISLIERFHWYKPFNVGTIV